MAPILPLDVVAGLAGLFVSATFYMLGRLHERRRWQRAEHEREQFLKARIFCVDEVHGADVSADANGDEGPGNSN